MTEKELIEMAYAQASQRLIVENMGMMNTPSDFKERVKSDVQYRVAIDKLTILTGRYQAALREFVLTTPPASASADS